MVIAKQKSITHAPRIGGAYAYPFGARAPYVASWVFRWDGLLLLFRHPGARLFGIGPPLAALRTLNVSAEQGANEGNATQIDIVVVYGGSADARLPKTGPDWFRQRDALQKELAGATEVLPLEVDTPSASFAVKLPKKVKSAVSVYAFANHAAPEGWPLITLTPYKEATLHLQPISIKLEQE